MNNKKIYTILAAGIAVFISIAAIYAQTGLRITRMDPDRIRLEQQSSLTVRFYGTDLDRIDRVQALRNNALTPELSVHWRVERSILIVDITATAKAAAASDYRLNLSPGNTLMRIGLRPLEIPFEVTARQLSADLNMNCTIVPQTVNAGDKAARLSITVQNRGPDQAVFSPNAIIFNYTSALTGTSRTSNYSRPQQTILLPNQVFQTSVPLDLSSLPPSQQTMTYTLQAAADPASIIGDSNRKDNTASCAITIARNSFPDLTIKSVTLIPAAVASDRDFTAHVTVKNIGSAAASLASASKILSAALTTERLQIVGSSVNPETESRNYTVSVPASAFRLEAGQETSYDIVMHSYARYKGGDWNHEMSQKLEFRVDPENRLPSGANWQDSSFSMNNTISMNPVPWEADVRRWELSDCVLNPAAPVSGGMLQITVSLKNTGNVRIPVPQGAVYLQVLGSNFSYSQMGGQGIFLDPGQTRQFQFVYPTAPDRLQPGTYPLTMSTYDGASRVCTVIVPRPPIIMY